MEQSMQTEVDSVQNNTINRYLTQVSTSMLAGGLAYNMLGNQQATEAWIFRDDVGAPGGIKGYEEQVNSVGMLHGHSHWPHMHNWNTWNSATLREASRSLLARARVATEPCIRNMISLWTRVSNRLNFRPPCSTCPVSTPLIRSIVVTSSRSGITGSVSSTTACGRHTRLSMRQRAPTSVCGPQSSPRPP